jgi:hypothetical protein
VTDLINVIKWKHPVVSYRRPRTIRKMKEDSGLIHDAP